MGIEAQVQQTAVATVKMAWSMLTDVNDLNVIRHRGKVGGYEVGKFTAETLAAQAPESDAYAALFNLLNLQGQTRSTAMLVQRMVLEELKRQGLDIANQPGLLECIRDLTKTLQQNETLLKEFRSLCALMQAGRTDQIAQGTSLAGSLVNKALSTTLSPLLQAALKSAPTLMVGGAGLTAATVATGGTALGVVVISAVVAYGISAKAEKDGQLLSQEIKHNTTQVAKQSNKSVAELLTVLKQHDPELQSIENYIDSAIRSAKLNSDPALGMDILTDLDQIKDAKKGERRVRDLETSYAHATEMFQQKTKQLWATLDARPTEYKADGLWSKTKDVFRTKEALAEQKMKDYSTKQSAIDNQRAAIDSWLDTITEKMTILKSVIDQRKGITQVVDEQRTTFHTVTSSSSVLRALGSSRESLLSEKTSPLSDKKEASKDKGAVTFHVVKDADLKSPTPTSIRSSSPLSPLDVSKVAGDSSRFFADRPSIKIPTSPPPRVAVALVSP